MPTAAANVPVFKPLLGRDELDAAREALEMGWLGMGSYVGEFEVEVARVSGADQTDRHVVAVSTGHAALHLALLLADAGPDTEIVTPSFNNIADLQAILATGAEPVFVDIDPHSLCIDLNKAEALVTAKTRAVIVMDYASTTCDHDAVAAFAKRHPDLRIIHDAAHAFGSAHDGKPVGSFSDLTMFSFDPVKTITTIDGGALIVRTAEEAEQLREMRLIGMGQPTTVMYTNQRAWTYDVKRLGFRYHLANLHAKIGLAQVAQLPAIAQTRRDTTRRFNKAFAELPGLTLPPPIADDIAPFLYYVRLDADRREAFRDHLHSHGVDTGIHWQPGHWFSLFKHARRGDLSVTETIGRQIVSLPMHSMMAPADERAVIDAVTSFFD